MTAVVNWGVLGAAAIAVERTMPGMQQAPSINLLAIASCDKAKAEVVAADLAIEEALSYRNHPQWQTVGDLLTAGTIGEIGSVHATMANRFPDPTDIRNNPDVGGGSLYDMGPYLISACNLIYHRAPTRVVGALQTHPEFGVDGLSSALLDYGGRHASITVSIHNGPTGWGSHQQLTALGTNGWFRLTFPFAHGRPTPCRVEVGDTTSVGAYPTSTHEFPPLNQYQLQVDRFSRFVFGEQVPSWPLEDARDTARTINALFASARNGAWVALAECRHQERTESMEHAPEIQHQISSLAAGSRQHRLAVHIPLTTAAAAFNNACTVVVGQGENGRNGVVHGEFHCRLCHPGRGG